MKFCAECGYEVSSRRWAAVTACDLKHEDLSCFPHQSVVWSDKTSNEKHLFVIFCFPSVIPMKYRKVGLHSPLFRCNDRPNLKTNYIFEIVCFPGLLHWLAISGVCRLSPQHIVPAPGEADQW